MRPPSSHLKAAAVRAFTIGTVSTCCFGLVYFFPHFRTSHLDQTHKAWLGLLGCYWVLPFPFYFFTFWRHPERRYDRASKPLLILAFIDRLRRKGPTFSAGVFRSFHARLSILSLLVKYFYLPLMTMFFVDHWIVTTDLLRNFPKLADLKASDWLFGNPYELMSRLIFFVDTAIFSFGYAVELPSLKSRIRSVEPTVLGWFVTLLCYPPFNTFGSLFPARLPGAFDFPVVVQGGLRMTILLLYLVYGWASVALLFKGSNLTNRGIVGSGPYRFVRHPAYVAKNLAWWLEALPWLHRPIDFLFLLFWNFIYFLRAWTEERHLGRDPSYRAYAQRVKYMFVPGLI